MSKARVGVLGATSFTGRRVLAKLAEQGYEVIAFSRSTQPGVDISGIKWAHLKEGQLAAPSTPAIENWLCLAPIWALPDLFEGLQTYGVRRLVAFSSTSRFTKAAGTGSQDPSENALAKSLATSEEALTQWASQQGVAWTILRPTLIYGLNQDRNLSEIARFIRKFGFFPLLGSASGKRQPIHVDDVAVAAISALQSERAVNRAYNISGGEVLTYKEMVIRIFAAIQRTPRFVPVPLLAFKLGVSCLRVLPRYRHWTASMAQRMNRDQHFEHADAVRDFGFSARPFDF